MVHGEPPRVKNIGRHDSPRGSDERLWRGCGVNRFPRKRRRQAQESTRHWILSRFLKTAAFNRKLHRTGNRWLGPFLPLPVTRPPSSPLVDDPPPLPLPPT